MSSDQDAKVARSRGRYRAARGAFAVLLGTLVVPLDSAVNVDFPFITRHFGLPIPLIQWIVISYTLTSSSLLLVFGRAADILGHRRVFLVGCGWSALAFVVCALAPSYPWLLAGRVLQGVGAGLVLSCGPALITALYPETQRARALGLYTLGFGLGGALGPVLGGVLVARFGWSAVFWARAPIAALGGLVSLTLPAPAAAPRRDRFDLLGAWLLIIAIGALLLALNRVRTPLWALLAAGLGGLSLAGFIRQELRTRHPILDLHPFRDFGFSLATIGNTLLNLVGFAVLLLVPFQLARMPGLSTVVSGLLLAALPAGVMLAGPIAGRLASRVPSAALMAAGAAFVSAGLTGIAAFPARAGALAGMMMLAGLGLGAFQVAFFDVLTGAMPARNRGVAGSLGMLTRTLGLVTGATVLMAVFQASRTGAALRGLDPAAAFSVGFRETFELAAALPVLLIAADLLRRAVRRS
ncbi:MAG: MFS transporter [Rhodospirillales bacterium]|nr:MFS transporter [Rhodospirillales bacterium]